MKATNKQISKELDVLIARKHLMQKDEFIIQLNFLRDRLREALINDLEVSIQEDQIINSVEKIIKTQ